MNVSRLVEYSAACQDTRSLWNLSNFHTLLISAGANLVSGPFLWQRSPAAAAAPPLRQGSLCFDAARTKTPGGDPEYLAGRSYVSRGQILMSLRRRPRARVNSVPPEATEITNARSHRRVHAERIRLYFPSSRRREIADDISFDIAVLALFLYFSSRLVPRSRLSPLFPALRPRLRAAPRAPAVAAASPLPRPENKLFNLY